MDRALWTLGLVAFIALMAGLLLLGWRHRAGRQVDIPALPEVPATLGADLVEPLAGVYVATTRSGSWQDRVVVHTLGRRAAAEVRAVPEGVLIDRVGETPVFIPAASITMIGTAPGIAGKVIGQPDGILVISWRLGSRLLDSGIRAEDRDLQQDWIAAARGLVSDAGDFDTPIDTPTTDAPATAPEGTEDQGGSSTRTDGATA
ncbi:transporter [Nakamurella sp. YIM 132087]|uniref:Transporter n=1 Tax=Nakamurella alba TaxID=2665158 RepID=A0A7K1FHM6_9ACTN|nr:transporter [Nakamurella alba]MTD12949.1 transporter [Nakamurella alba]